MPTASGRDQACSEERAVLVVPGARALVGCGRFEIVRRALAPLRSELVANHLERRLHAGAALERRPQDLVAFDDPCKRGAELGHVERPVELEHGLGGACRALGLGRPDELLLGGEPEAHCFVLHVLAFHH